MKTIECFVIRHGEEGKNGLSEKGKITSVEKGEEILKLIGEIGDRVIKIIHSDTTRAKGTGENIAEGIGTKECKVIETYDRQNAENFANNVSTVVNEFTESNLIIIVIGHLHTIYNIAEKLGYKGNPIKKPNNLEGYHFTAQVENTQIKKQEGLKIGDKIESTCHIISDIGPKIQFGTREIVGVEIDDGQCWIFLDNESREVLCTNINGRKFRIINIGAEGENEKGEKGIKVKIQYIECSRWLLVNPKTLKVI